MAAFDENNGKTHLQATKGSQAVELLKSWCRSEIYGSCEIPVVIYVLRLSHQLILNRGFTGATDREFFPADNKGLVRHTMTA